MSNTEILETAVGIARETGEMLREGLERQKEVGSKSSGIDLVTEYDTRSEAHISQKLQSLFPEHRVIGEEGTDLPGPPGDSGGGLVWYIDPLDGTVNYAHGYPVYALSMALYQGNEPRLGVVYDPERGECFTAIAGAGAFLRRDGRPERRLAVSKEVALERSLLATGFPYDRQTSTLDNLAEMAAFLKTARGVRRSGSSALDICYVAAGRLDGFWEYKLNIWDVAAAAIVLNEAGGQVSMIDTGRPFAPQPVLNILAANPVVHRQMARVLGLVHEKKQAIS